MKVESLHCPNCGAPIQFDPASPPNFCTYCGSALSFDDGIHHTTVDNAHDFGYQFEQGRMRAQQEARARAQAGDNQPPRNQGAAWVYTTAPSQTTYVYPDDSQQLLVKSVNKHVFVWVYAFLLGGLGIDRFVRGQIGWGLLKLFTAGFGGLWWFIDFTIALYKAYIVYGAQEDVQFLAGHWTA